MGPRPPKVRGHWENDGISRRLCSIGNVVFGLLEHAEEVRLEFPSEILDPMRVCTIPAVKIRDILTKLEGTKYIVQCPPQSRGRSQALILDHRVEKLVYLKLRTAHQHKSLKKKTDNSYTKYTDDHAKRTNLRRRTFLVHISCTLHSHLSRRAEYIQCRWLCPSPLDQTEFWKHPRDSEDTDSLLR